MKHISFILVNQCLKITTMLFPSMLWVSLCMLDIYFSISHVVFTWLSYLLMLILALSILFTNRILTISYDNENFEQLVYQWQKINVHRFIQGIFTGTPLLMIIFYTPIWLLLIYGIIQIFYVLLDKEHLSMMERLYSVVIKEVIHFKIKKRIKKEQQMLSADVH
ncbi:MAG: hypothetical protein EOM50_05590 [Erysipelotrichia bacterium]|nr:hypothetical protein [Erysipelotrichia bacterium]NCC54202.1 hypothetical protein [Erysipelotrichia bacterium]